MYFLRSLVNKMNKVLTSVFNLKNRRSVHSALDTTFQTLESQKAIRVPGPVYRPYEVYDQIQQEVHSLQDAQTNADGDIFKAVRPHSMRSPQPMPYVHFAENEVFSKHLDLDVDERTALTQPKLHSKPTPAPIIKQFPPPVDLNREEKLEDTQFNFRFTDLSLQSESRSDTPKTLSDLQTTSSKLSLPPNPSSITLEDSIKAPIMMNPPVNRIPRIVLDQVSRSHYKLRSSSSLPQSSENHKQLGFSIPESPIRLKTNVPTHLDEDRHYNYVMVKVPKRHGFTETNVSDYLDQNDYQSPFNHNQTVHISSFGLDLLINLDQATQNYIRNEVQLY